MHSRNDLKRAKESLQSELTAAMKSCNWLLKHNDVSSVKMYAMELAGIIQEERKNAISKKGTKRKT